MHSERCMSGSARGHAKLPVARSARRACPTQPKLKGPAKWTCLHLYVILDIFSRYVVGWLIAQRECADLAEQLIAETVARHDVERGMLTLHADRGTSALQAGGRAAGRSGHRQEPQPALRL